MRAVPGVVCSALLALALAASVTVAAADTGTPPVFVQTIGGPNHAQMYPSGLEVSPDGSIVIADTGNNKVAKYSSSGVLQWVIGTHGAGTGQFQQPRDVAVDSSANIYVVDTMNRRIVKLSPTGSWMTSWGSTSGDRVGTPMGISISSDKVYVADAGQNLVRVYDTTGVLLAKFGSNGACNVAGLRDVDADASGTIYVVGYKVNQIEKFSPSGTCLSTFGGSGKANGKLRAPYGVRVATDPVAGVQRVYVADANNNRLQVFSLSGAWIATIGSYGVATQPGTLTTLRRVAVASNGDVWAADLWGWRIERWARTSNGYTYAQTTGAPLPTSTDTSVFHEVRQVAFLSSGNLVAADTVHQRFVVMTPAGHLLSTCGDRGSPAGQFNWPRGVAVDQATDNIWVADTKQYRIQVIKPDCSPLSVFGSQGSGPDQFKWIDSIVIRQSDRTAWVADTQNNRVKVYDVATQALIGSYGVKGTGVGAFRQPSGVAVDPANGHILVADTLNNRIVELSDTGGSTVTWVRTYSASFAGPMGVAADSLGRIYVADTGNDRVVVLNPDGSVRGTIGGPGTFDTPEDVSVDSNNTLYVSDTYNDRIRTYS